MARRQTGGRFRAVVFLAASLCVAGVAVLVVFRVIHSYEAELVDASAPEEMVQLVVAAVDLYPGRTIVAADLKPMTLPPDYVPDPVLRQTEQAVGRVPRERILANEFVREERLADPAAGLGLNAIIPKGMRALSINISNGSAVSGFLNPGNYVDVVVTLRATDTAPAETHTMMQAVTILAVNTRLGDEEVEHDNVKPSVTLAVTPDQAERLTHAFEQAEITLTLRNDIDVTNVATNGAISKKLLGGDSDEKRIMIPEWKERAKQNSDGSLIIIKGPEVQRERVSPSQ
jgi:pilus assembly protein CpaB